MDSNVRQKMDVEGELRLELRGVDVLSMEAERNPLRKLYARDRLRREAARVVHHEFAAVFCLIVHVCCQVPVILACIEQMCARSLLAPPRFPIAMFQ